MCLEMEGMLHTRSLFQGPSTSMGNSLINRKRYYRSTAKHLMYIDITQDASYPRYESVEETPLHELIDREPLMELQKDILRANMEVNINITETRVGRVLPFLPKQRTSTCNLEHGLYFKGLRHNGIKQSTL